MPLNLSISDGEFTPYIKYNAKAGRWYVKPEGATQEVEIQNPSLAFDMTNIRTGWLFYTEGSGPEKVWDPSATQMAAKPAGPRKFKRGFEVMVYGNGVIPGTAVRLGLREFSSTAANVIAAMLRMHAEYEAGLAANRGKVPVYACKGVTPINGAYGVNYEPQFVLAQWVDRSRVPAFDEQAAPAPAPSAGVHDELSPPPHTGNGNGGIHNEIDEWATRPAPARRAPQARDMDDDIPF